jgi:hypothetical protein
MYTYRNMRATPDLRELENVRKLTSYAIQSQYSASKKILALAGGFQSRLLPEADVDLFYRKMFDIYTAEGVGLDNWGVILGIGRSIPGPYLIDCFGFDLSERHPFDQYPFVEDFLFIPVERNLLENANSVPPGCLLSNHNSSRSYITLDDESFRLLLLYKAMANISASTAEVQNSLLAMLVATGISAFPRAAYVLEVDAMVIRWVFEDFLNPLQLAVFKAAGTLARGAGVGWELYAVNPQEVFGFDGGDWQPFGQAPFAGGRLLLKSPGRTEFA